MVMRNLPEFDLHSDPRNLLNRWKQWVTAFSTAMVSFKITCENRQRALLIYYDGHELTDVLESLDDTGTDDEIEPAIVALTRYFTPKNTYKRETMEIKTGNDQNTHTGKETLLQRVSIWMGEESGARNLKATAPSKIVLHLPVSQILKKSLEKIPFEGASKWSVTINNTLNSRFSWIIKHVGQATWLAEKM